MLFSPAFLPGVMAAAGGGGPPAEPQDWPTENLLFSLDPDDTTSRTIVNSGGVDYVRRLTAPQDAAKYVENTDNASCPVLETKNGRGVLTFNGTNRFMATTAELNAVLGAINAPRTFHAVRYMPAAGNTFEQGILGVFPFTGTNLRQVFYFESTEQMGMWAVDSTWTLTGNPLTTIDTGTWQRGVPVLLTWRINADRSVDMFRDGVLMPDNGAAMPDITLNTAGLMGGLGHDRWDGANSGFLDGSLGALLWYSVAQSDSAIANIAAVKNSRYV